MKEEERILRMDNYEHGIVINALNTLLNNLIGQQRPTDPVDNLLLKAIEAPHQKLKRRGQCEAR